ncbi:MAG: hypothetical protein H6745_06450 [Deltaproteobacteria bacterium]|nr:hypothetical protein [Deltaproteobacteria bacterium]
MHVPTGKGPLTAPSTSEEVLSHAGLVRRDGRRRPGLLPLGAEMVDAVLAHLAARMPGGAPQSVIVPDDSEPVEGMVAMARQDLRSYRELPLRLGVRRGSAWFIARLSAAPIGELGALGEAIAEAGLGVTRVVAPDGDGVVVVDEAGGYAFLACSRCGAAAEAEVAPIAPTDHGPTEVAAGEPEVVSTPGSRRVDDVCELMGVAPRELLKTLLWRARGEVVGAREHRSSNRPSHSAPAHRHRRRWSSSACSQHASSSRLAADSALAPTARSDYLIGALVAGDRELSPAKLARALDVPVAALALATAAEVEAATGAEVGFAGPLGLEAAVLSDTGVSASTAYVTGANRTGHHLRGVRLGRDLPGGYAAADLVVARVGDRCGVCGDGALEAGAGWRVARGSTAAAGVRVDGEGGGSVELLCEQVALDGLEALRALASRAAAREAALALPAFAYPAAILVVALDEAGSAVARAAADVARAIAELGEPVALDDRSARAGRKLGDAELIGWPVRVLIGRRGVDRGEAEIVLAAAKDGPRAVPLAEVAAAAVAMSARVVGEEEAR